tara:strand:- start:2620 stop:3033 length:414 start_codon:yes stop_codon:yes gene_type:complete
MSTKNKMKEMKELFSVFDDPMDKYTQIIELGKKNKGLNEIDKTDKNRIYGCASLAWVKTIKNGKLYSIQIDSDTFIVRGLLNILQYVIRESSKEEIFQLNIQNILGNIGLEQSITSQRTNGFLSALDKIKNQINNYE